MKIRIILALLLILLVIELHIAIKERKQDVYRENVDSVVELRTYGLVDDNFTLIGHYSGFVYENDGVWLVTALHCLKLEDKQLKSYMAYFRPQLHRPPQELVLVGFDETLDLALLRFVDESAAAGLRSVKLGSAKDLKLGDRVVTIGHPKPIYWARLSGEVVDMDYGLVDAVDYPRLIIHDGKINPGASGSPLFNKRGEVVGINLKMIPGRTSKELLVPLNHYSGAALADHLQIVFPRLKKGGEVKHLLVEVLCCYSHSLTEFQLKMAGIKKYPKKKGLVVVTPTNYPDSQWRKKIGLRPGDLILAVNGQPVADLHELYEALYLKHNPAKRLVIRIDRYGQEMNLGLTPN